MADVPAQRAGVLLGGLARAVGGLPPGAAQALGRGLGAAVGSVLRVRRADARAALARAFPDAAPRERRRILRAAYANLGLTAVEFLRLARIDAETLRGCVDIEHAERLDAALARGRGVCALTAHTGNWELPGLALPLLGYPLAAIAKPIKNARIDAFVRRARTRFGLELLPSRGAYRACLRVLRRNGLLAFMLDQNMTRVEGVFVDFLGRPACTTPGLAHLAAAARAPVVPIFAGRRPGGRHVLRVLPALDPPPDRAAETLRAATQEYTRIIEDHIRAFPGEWIWIHRRWRTVPREDPGRRVESRGVSW